MCSSDLRVWIIEPSSVWGDIQGIGETECIRSVGAEIFRRRGWDTEVSPNIGPGLDIGNVLGASCTAGDANELGVPDMTGSKRKAGDCEHGRLPRKAGRPAKHQNIAITHNLESAGVKSAIIARSGRERRVSEKVATKLADEAAAKAAKEAAKEVKATKVKGKTKTSRSSWK